MPKSYVQLQRWPLVPSSAKLPGTTESSGVKSTSWQKEEVKMPGVCCLYPEASPGRFHKCRG